MPTNGPPVFPAQSPTRLRAQRCASPRACHSRVLAHAVLLKEWRSSNCKGLTVGGRRCRGSAGPPSKSLEKLARRTGGGKVANRQWKTCEQQLASPRTAMLCATTRVQVSGTQRYANNAALARGTGGGKVASRPKSHGEWCLKLRQRGDLGEHRKTLPHATHRALPGTTRPYDLLLPRARS